MLLAARKPVTALAHYGVVPVWEAVDRVVDARRTARLLELGIRRLGLRVPQVLGDRRVKEIGLLTHNADVLDEALLAQATHVDAAHLDGAVRDVVQAGHEVRDGCLARARGTDERHELPRLDLERHVIERGWTVVRRVGVSEHDIVKADASPLRRIGIARVSRLRDARFEIEILEDAREQRPARLQVERDPHEPHERVSEASLHRREGDDRARRDRDILLDEPRRHQVDDSGNDREEDVDRGEEPLAAHGELHLQTALRVVLGSVALDLALLPVKALGEQNTRDTQGLLRDRRHVAQRLLGLRRDARAHLTDATLGDDEQRQQHDRDDRELPTEDEHRDERGDHRDRVADHARHRVVQHAGDPADVVLQPRLDDARLGAGEEAEFHCLQVLEQPHPQLGHDAVADRRREEGLADADARRGEPQHEHRTHELQQHGDVRGALRREQPAVERLLSEQRGYHADRGRHEHEGDRDGERGAVRPEELSDARQKIGNTRGFGVGRPLRGNVAARHA